MKKALSILMVSLMMLTFIHLTVATHFCEGHLAGVRVSESGQKATCGMEAMENSCIPFGNGISQKGCCQNEVVGFMVDHNYNPTEFHLSPPTQILLQVFAIPQNAVFLADNKTSDLHTNVRPPGKFIPSDVYLSDICVFLI